MSSAMESPESAGNRITSTVNAVESESGLALLARLGNRPSLVDLDPCLFPGGPQAGDVIEVSGNRNCGKSLLCLRLVVAVLLPQIWKGFNVGGCGGGVIYVDSDLHFNILHLENMMQRRIKKVLKMCKDAMKKKKLGHDIDERLIDDGKEVQEILHSDKTSLKVKIDKLVRESLKSFLYLKCTDSSQFAITLMSMDELIMNKTSVSLIIIDSISAFYWYDRSYRAETWYKLEQYYSRIFKVFLGHVKKHKLVLLSTRQSLFQKRSVQDDCQSKYLHQLEEEELEEGLTEYEYMGREWASHVTCRIYLSMLNPGDMSVPKSDWEPRNEANEKSSVAITGLVKSGSDKRSDRQMYSAEVTKKGKKIKLVFTVHEDGVRWRTPS